ncbi:hypothetical protein F2Q69_00012557 [Brassica cretica]|uniref:Uncharacterized protein n=1 Tax=Brassica cretica TaxID=69181 RepID=A0A8S9R998_BRACR|nr:hypothetical protein F2Q69_00012557 [Brassica cretica]
MLGRCSKQSRKQASTLHEWLDHYRRGLPLAIGSYLDTNSITHPFLRSLTLNTKSKKTMARITHLPHSHAATRLRVASPITRVFASCLELNLVRPRTRHGPLVATNDSHDTPPECRTFTEQVRGFTGFVVKM